MYLYTFIAVAFLPTAFSQSNVEATCNGGDVNWAFNSAGSSPCQVAGALAGVCSSDWVVGPVMMGEAYSPSANPDDCQCNTVTYSMLSACSACQGGTWLSFGRFTENCSSVFMSTFPKPLPAGLKVPAWAYNDIQLTSDSFNPQLAQLQTAIPESTAIVSTTQLIPPVLSTQATTQIVSSTPTPTSSQSPSVSQTANNTVSTSAVPSGSSLPAGAITVDSSSSGSSAGAIVGGVVGGISALVLILCLLLFYLRHRLRHPQLPHSSTTQYTTETGDKSDMPNTIEKPLACQSLAFYDASDRSTHSAPETGTINSHASHYVPYSKTPAARNSLRHSQTHHRILRSITSSPAPGSPVLTENPFEDPETCISEITETKRHDESE